MGLSDCEEGKQLLKAAAQPNSESGAHEANNCSLLSKVLHFRGFAK